MDEHPGAKRRAKEKVWESVGCGDLTLGGQSYVLAREGVDAVRGLAMTKGVVDESGKW